MSKHQLSKIFYSVISLGLIFGTISCQSTSSKTDTPTSTQKTAGRLNTELTLNNALFEQSNGQGNLQWKIKAKSTIYSEDRKIANLEKVTANLIQDGEIILKLKGDKGEILEDGSLIFLRDNVVATDNRNQTVLKSSLMEWRPQLNILEISQKITGFRDNISLQGNKATYFTDTENLELFGQVIINAKNPFIKLETDSLLWQIPQQKIVGNKPWNIIRYEGEIVTDRLVADRGEWNLANQTLALENNIELISLSPQLQMATNSAKWNYQKRTIISDRPIQILDRQQQMTITGNQGYVDFVKNIANLSQGVEGEKKINPATFFANNLTWNIPTQIIEAKGNVIYQQTSPVLELTGDNATIKLKENNAVVSSNKSNKRRVISVFSDDS